jgi:undecaprenyl pyrophosphate synthase
MSQTGEAYAHDTEVSASDPPCSAVPAHVALILVPEEPAPRTSTSEPRHDPRALCDAVLELQARGVKQLTLSAFGELSSWACRAAPSEARRFADFIAYATPCLVAAGIRVSALGDVDELPISLREGLERLLRATRHGRGMSLTLLVSYAGRADIVETARHLAALVHAGLLIPEDIDEELFRSRMRAAELPAFDLCIRSHQATPAHEAFPFHVTSAETFDISPDASQLGEELSSVFASPSTPSPSTPSPSTPSPSTPTTHRECASQPPAASDSRLRKSCGRGVCISSTSHRR